MKKLLSIVLLALPALAYSVDISIDNFTGGLNTKKDPLFIDFSNTQDCSNVQFDDKNAVETREGYTLYCTLPESGVIYGGIENKISTGEDWLIVQIDSNVYSTKNAGTSWSTVKTGLSTLNPCNFTKYGNMVIGTNGINDPFGYNGSTTNVYSFIPNGKFIETLYDQIYIACTPENPTAMYASSVFESPFTAGGWTNDYQITFPDDIAAIKAYQNGVVVFTRNTTWGVIGSGGNIDRINYSYEYGCVSQRSVQEHDGKLYFLSEKGLCTLDRNIISKVDSNIESYTQSANIIASTAVKKTWTQRTRDDFSLGQSSSVIVSDDIGISTDDPQYGDNKILKEAKTFEQGEEYRTDSGGAYNTTIAIPHKATVTLPDNDTVWYSLKNVSVNLARATPTLYKSTITVVVYTSSDTVLASQSQYIDDLPGEGQWYIFFPTTTIKTRQSFKVELKRRRDVAASGYFGDGAALKYLTYQYTVPVEKELQDLYEYTKTVLGPGENLAPMKTYMNNVGWEEVQTYYQPVGRVTNSTPVLNTVTEWRRILPKENIHGRLAVQYEYSVVASTWGYYYSQIFNAGSSLTSWKTFVVGDKGDGIVYRVLTATGSTAIVTNPTMQTVTNGDTITSAASKTWVRWKAEFNSNKQRIFGVNISWFEGTADYGDVASYIHESHYGLGMATTGTANTDVFVMDDNNAFTRWKLALSPGNFIRYDNKTLFSNSNKIYRLYNGYTDAGTNIGWYWISKNIGVPENNVRLNWIALVHKSTGSITFTAGWKSNYDASYTTTTISTGNTIDTDVFRTYDQSQSKYYTLKLFGTKAAEVDKIKVSMEATPLIPQ